MAVVLGAVNLLKQLLITFDSWTFVGFKLKNISFSSFIDTVCSGS